MAQPDMRWTVRRKAEVCRLVLDGEATFEEMALRHGLGVEELTAWINGYRRRGLAGLAVTRCREVNRG